MQIPTGILSSNKNIKQKLKNKDVLPTDLCSSYVLEIVKKNHKGLGSNLQKRPWTL